VENGDPLQETFKLYQPGPVLSPVALRLLYIDQGAVRLSHLVIIFGGVGSIWLTWLLVFLGISIVEGHLLGQGILDGDDQCLLECPGILHGELANQGWISKSLLDEHDDGLIVDLQDDVPFVAEMMDESKRDSPFFYLMLAKSQSTLGCSQVVQRLLINCQHKSDHERTDPMGSPMSEVLAGDERQIDR
jgi:hypothetical protein